MTKHFFIFFLALISWNSASANQRIKSLEEKLPLTTDTARVNTLNKLSYLYSSIDLNHADSLARACFEYLKGLKYPEGQVKNYIHLSFINTSLGNFEDATDYVNTAFAASEELQDIELLAECYQAQFTLLFRMGDNSQAKTAASKALSFAERADAKPILAKAYENLGILSGLAGSHSEAIEYFLKSLAIHEELKNQEAVTRALSNIGHTFELAGNYDKALDYLRQSLITNQRLGNKYGEAWDLVNIGVVHSRRNDTDSALFYYQRALSEAESLNNHRLILTCLDNLGGKYSMLKDFDQSNYYLRRAFKLSNESGENSRSVYILGNLAENYLYMEELDSARILAEQQLELALKADLVAEQKDAYDNLSRIYSGLGDYQAAYDALESYVTVNDSVFNQQKSEQIETLRETFEAEKKEQEIANLITMNESSRLRNLAYAVAAIFFLIIGVLLFYTQRLRTQRKEAELSKGKDLDRMKSRFFANISHEFRTPLTLILSPLEEIISKVQDRGAVKQLRILRSSANRLLGLVNQLLDLSKIESGKFKLDIASHNVFTILKGITKSYDTLAVQNHVRLELNIPDSQFYMQVDREKFETIITNILSNAFKFTPEGGVIIVNASVIETNSRKFLEILIKDSGSGIPQEDLDHIFNRFYQSNHHSEQPVGSGIGLALTKELVELHHGKIEAYNQVDSGAVLKIRIPANSSHPDAMESDAVESQVIYEPKVSDTISIDETAAVTLENAIAPKHSNGQLPLLLIIEDHQEVSNYLKDIFIKKYHVHLAENGESGIEKAKDLIPDIIISDVMMPKKNGYEVCDQLKNDERTSHIPIILLTAKADIDDRIEGYTNLADDYLAKPFVPRELLVRVKRLIDNREKLRAKYKQDGLIRPKEMAGSSVDEKFLNRVVDLIEANMDNSGFGVEQMGLEIGMSRSQLHRKLTALINQGPNQFIRAYRLQRAHNLIKQNTATTAEIAYQVGFTSPSYFTRCFSEQFGYTPKSMNSGKSKKGHKK